MITITWQGSSHSVSHPSIPILKVINLVQNINVVNVMFVVFISLGDISFRSINVSMAGVLYT